MELFFGIVLLVLAAGMVVLFAMVGELASRVGDQTGRSRSAEVLPLEQARVGHLPAGWPAGLAPLGAADRAVLLVLSTVCHTCRQLAPEVAELAGTGGVDGRPLIGVVVTCGNAPSGAEFVGTYGLDRLPHHVDVAGDWVQDEFDIHTSPAAVLLGTGRVRAAVLFDDVAALLARSAQILAAQQPAHQQQPVDKQQPVDRQQPVDKQQPVDRQQPADKQRPADEQPAEEQRPEEVVR